MRIKLSGSRRVVPIKFEVNISFSSRHVRHTDFPKARTLAP